MLGSSTAAFVCWLAAGILVGLLPGAFSRPFDLERVGLNHCHVGFDLTLVVTNLLLICFEFRIVRIGVSLLGRGAVWSSR